MRNALTTILAVIGFAASCSAVAAGKVTTEKSTVEDEFKYYSPGETRESFKLRLSSKDSRGEPSADRILVYKLMPNDFGISAPTLCASFFAIEDVKTSWVGSNKVIRWSWQYVNASQLVSTEPANDDDRKKLGVQKDDFASIHRVNLNDGRSFLAVSAHQTSFGVCGPDVQGKKLVASSKVILTSEAYDVAQNATPEKACTARKNFRPNLGYTDERYQFDSSAAVDEPLTNCQASAQIQAAAEAEAKRKADSERQQRIADEEARYEAVKRAHQMKSGVTILGEIGASRAASIVSSCLRTYTPIASSRGYESQETIRVYRCGGYYPEEVADLRREMRIRGLIDN